MRAKQFLLTPLAKIYKGGKICMLKPDWLGEKAEGQNKRFQKT